MCVAIWAPEGVEIPLERLRSCFEFNPHGAGLMFARDGRLEIRKELMDFESFWRESEAARGFARALHFRYATHGDRGADNTHPFRIGERLGVAHNGRLEQVDRSSDPRRSDTWHFARSYLGPIALADPEFPFGRGGEGAAGGLRGGFEAGVPGGLRAGADRQRGGRGVGGRGVV